MLSTQAVDVDAVDLSLCLYTIQQQAYDSSWFQWAATVWMHVMLSLKDSRHGLSSIYSLFLHFEKSTTFGTVGCSKVFYGNTQWNFSLCWFCLNLFFSCRPHPCMRWRCSLLRCLQRRGGWRLQAMRSWRIQQAQTNSAFFKFTALFVWLRMGFVWLWMGPQESKGVHKLVIHKSFCWHWHSCFAVLWPQDRKWHSPWWPCFSSVNDFAISFVEQTQVLVITSSFLLCCFSCTCFSLINYSALSVRRREKHGSCSSIEGHHWLHRSRTAQACTHLCKSSIGRACCECTTRTPLLFAGVEQKPHVQTKLDNLLVFQSLFKYRKILGFSESLKQSCLNFPLSGFLYRCDC